jgi:hypothetical protein
VGDGDGIPVQSLSKSAGGACLVGGFEEEDEGVAAEGAADGAAQSSKSKKLSAFLDTFGGLGYGDGVADCAAAGARRTDGFGCTHFLRSYLFRI